MHLRRSERETRVSPAPHIDAATVDDQDDRRRGALTTTASWFEPQAQRDAAELDAELERGPRVGKTRIDDERVAARAQPREPVRERLPQTSHRAEVHAAGAGPA